MTICAAAICKVGDESVIIGIADRMYTRGRDPNQTEYESAHSKTYIFRDNVIGLTAGDGDFALEISRLTDALVNATSAETVSAVANLYAADHALVRNRRTEVCILGPLGLNREMFLSRQSELDPALVADTAAQMQDQYWHLGTQSLIFGVDATGPHIYEVIDPGLALYREKPGFLAIGYGAQHFETVFMAARYDSNWPFMRALMLAFTAKRQAQMAPGVGETTDIFIVRKSGHRILSERDVEFSVVNQHHGLLMSKTRQLQADTVSQLTAALPNFP